MSEIFDNPSSEYPDPSDVDALARAESELEPIDFGLLRMLWRADEISAHLHNPEGIPRTSIDEVLTALNEEFADSGLERHRALLSGRLYELPLQPGGRTDAYRELLEHADGGYIADAQRVIMEKFEIDRKSLRIYLKVSLTTESGDRSVHAYKAFPADIQACTTEDIVGIEARRDFCARYLPEFIEWLDALPTELDDDVMLRQLAALDYTIAKIDPDTCASLLRHMNTLIRSNFDFDNVVSSIRIRGPINNSDGAPLGTIPHTTTRQMQIVAPCTFRVCLADGSTRITGGVQVEDLNDLRLEDPTTYFLPVSSIHGTRSRRNSDLLQAHIQPYASKDNELAVRASRVERIAASLQQTAKDFDVIMRASCESLIETRNHLLDTLMSVIVEADDRRNPSRYILDQLGAIMQEVPHLTAGREIIIHNAEKIASVPRGTHPSEAIELAPGSTLLAEFCGITALRTDDETWHPALEVSSMALHSPEGTTSAYTPARRWYVYIDKECDLLVPTQ